MKSHNKNFRDFIIVGGGCAGLYCAWRILNDIKNTENNDNKKPKIKIFEKEDRIGGRLHSFDFFPHSELSNILKRAELGGMRFTSDQHLIINLIEDLKSEIHNYYSKWLNREPYKFETKLMYLRESYIDDKSLNTPKKLPYESLKNLKPSLTGEAPKINDAPVEITRNAIRETLNFMKGEMSAKGSRWKNSVEQLSENLKKSTLSAQEWRDWQENATLEKEHIYSIGFWTLMHKVTQRSFETNKNLKLDTVNFLRDSLGYQSLITEANAAQAIPVFLADFDTSYLTLLGGMETLPKALLHECEKIADDKKICSIEHSVRSIELVKDHDESFFRIEIDDLSEGKPDIYETKNVILALPKDALLKIKFKKFPEKDSRRFTENISKVTSYPACKLFLKYNEAWWTERGSLNYPSDSSPEMRVITDLPIRQIYYYGSEKCKPGFIMSYSDAHFTNYWIDKSPEWKPHVQATQAFEGKEIHPASNYIIDKAQLFLKRIHNKDEVAPVEKGLVREWEHAWHFWEPHAKPWKVAEEMVQPFDNIKLYTCGEAFSLEQGWVEGALKSAERVLLKIGLKQSITDEFFEPDNPEDKKQYENFVDYITH